MHNLSKLTLSLVTGSMLLGSTATFAAHNYKGEAAVEPVQASVVMPRNDLRDGFYVGAGLGYDSYRVRLSSTSTDANSTSSFNQVDSATGLLGELLVGYGQYFSSPMYLGAEAYLNSTNAKGKSSNNVRILTSAVNYNHRTNVNSSWGVSVLPGMKVSDNSLLYVRLGWNRTNMQSKYVLTEDNITTASSTSKGVNGFVYGLGMETSVAQNLSLRGEFDHVNLNSFTDKQGVKVDPSNNQFKLSLIYHFA